jgi:8-amino-7-oxononanoate synthase
MGGTPEEVLAAELEAWEARGLRRIVADDGPGPRVDFASNDYLDLATHPELVAAGQRALEQHGVGGRASRLLGGGGPLHAAAEAACAEWLGAESALLFPSGYQANLGVVGALVGRGDAIFSDRLNHASLIDAARLSRARVHVHEHLDLAGLERALLRERGARRRLVLTESVFSMDGDLAPLAELHALCARHDAWLVVDEAHAAGLLGPEGAGAWSALGDTPSERLAARVLTGGKALGVAGAFVAGPRAVREHLIQHARSFVFTTAPPPVVAGALARAIELVRAADDARAGCLARARELAERLDAPVPDAAIVPFVVGEAEAATATAAALGKAGFDVRAVRPPTVPVGTARLRLVVHAGNTDAEVEELARRLGEHGASQATADAPAELGEPLFVVGTDTGIGKTVVSALLLRAARRRGTAAYWKPIQTGDDLDSETVRGLAEVAEHEVLRPAWSLPLPASPHEAAAAAGVEIDPAVIAGGLGGLRRALRDARIVVELAGGLLVPYRGRETQADWLAEAAPPMVLVARSGLGTLNHTLLTLEALRARRLEPRALFLVGDRHDSNRETLRELGAMPHVFEVPRFDALDAATLDRWLDDHDLDPVFAP